MENIFGEVIHSYTRAEALADGELADVTETAQEAGIKFPVAVTKRVWLGVVQPDQSAKNRGESESGRLWDVLMMFRFRMASANPGENTLRYSVIATQKGKSKTYQLLAKVTPGDNFEPVITISFPNED